VLLKKPGLRYRHSLAGDALPSPPSHHPIALLFPSLAVSIFLFSLDESDAFFNLRNVFVSKPALASPYNGPPGVSRTPPTLASRRSVCYRLSSRPEE